MLLSLLLALQATSPAAVLPPSPGQIAEAAPADEWREISAEDLLVMELAPGGDGRARRVVIQLVPAPFSAPWVENIRKLARDRWWDGTSVNRVQDNYVAQWGDATETKRLPADLVAGTEDDYSHDLGRPDHGSGDLVRWAGGGTARLVTADRDPYAAVTAIHRGFPIAGGARGSASSGTQAWPVHCYGAVGVGRNLSPDTGTGAELYAVIGHAPRHLDRNIAVVGRVIEGMEHLSSLPRGSGPLGFYEQADERVPIRSIRLASDLAGVERVRFEYLDESGGTFARYLAARQNREQPFFFRPAGGADICNVPVPTRAVTADTR